MRAFSHSGLRARGCSIESHGVSHRAFSDLDLATLEMELRSSRRALEDELGQAVRAFAYPFGDPGSDPATTSQIAARAGYRVGFRYKGGGFVPPGPDRFHLPRIAMGPDTDLTRALGRIAT